jgi:uncharacterized protein (TIGR00730 family)
MPNRSHVCVFCGSSRGTRPSYAEAARRVGGALARGGLALVYGGGRVGLMGIVADAVLAEGGRVVGVIPDPLATKEVAHDGLTELFVVPGMHERKALMARKSEGFLTLPGGVGTFEEFFEILSWAVLGLHRKPIGILNVEGYFDPLLALLEHAVAEQFLRPETLDLLAVSDDPEALAADLLGRVPPTSVAGPKWIDLDET